jgi:hypothetical protein
MALFNECTQPCVHIVLDMADIVRDGDLSIIADTRLFTNDILISWQIAAQRGETSLFL